VFPGCQKSVADPDGREHFAALGPQQVAEYRSIGKSGRIDARVINRELLPQAGQHGIKELQVAVMESGLTALHLPAVLISVGINSTGAFQPLRVHNDCFRPDSLKVHAYCRGLAGASMAVKDKDQWQLVSRHPDCRLGRED